MTPVLVLSAHFAARFAAGIAAAAPEAHIVRHFPDGRWDGDPATGTVAHMSSDLWHTEHGAGILRLLPELPSLVWVHTSSAGVEHRSFRRLVERGVTLTSGAGINSPAIAQHVLALMLNHARRLPDYRAQQLAHTWKRLDCTELLGATVLIVGLGGIGRWVARLCHAFAMQVVGIRRSREPVTDVDRMLPLEALREGLAIADYVVLSCPLTDETRGLINATTLAAMKPTAYLVNVARGPVVETQALIEALQTGRIGGAAQDVFDREPLPAGSPLWAAPNFTLTPHTAGASPFNATRNAESFLANLERFAQGTPLDHVVE